MVVIDQDGNTKTSTTGTKFLLNRQEMEAATAAMADADALVEMLKLKDQREDAVRGQLTDCQHEKKKLKGKLEKRSKWWIMIGSGSFVAGVLLGVFVPNN